MKAAATAAPARPPRFERVDALRGAAMVWMAVFHFCFDLNYFRLLHPVQYLTRDPFWVTQRVCILSLFLLCAGAGQALALHAGQSWQRFWRRWAQVAGCALLVSLGSAAMFPKSWISFGVLHGIAVMLVISRLAAPLGPWLWPLGVGAILLPRLYADPFFNGPFTHWVGLVTRKPVTEDWVPLFPWLGVMLIGMAATQALLQHRPEWLAGRAPRPLVVLGRWSLTFYMLHQPLLIGALMAGRQLHWW